MKTLRQQLQLICTNSIDESMAAARQTLEQARAAQKEETKSSAGDKFETTREMMTQEIEKASALLAKLTEDKNRLQALPIDEASEAIQAGSVVFTNRGRFYLSIGLGAILHQGVKYQTISPSSPIGRLMMNKKKGERFTLNGNEYLVEEIF